MAALGPQRWQALSPYIDRALEMTAEERSGWLVTLRAEDPTLADDLALLLDEREALSREGFLEDSPAAPPPASLADQAFGAYTLVSQIGQGGMGSVWLARRSDGRFEGLAAVKLLNASLIGRAGGERFEREGHILARLRHPHIAHLLDAGLSPWGQPYLVLEHVDGERIDVYCDAERLAVEARLRLFLDVLGAVAHAHANLIVHRDIKPSNVLVTRQGRVKLLDFGIAKLIEAGAPGATATALTREGGAALTPEYAAPEQVTGGAVTTATDVYALGVLLYLLLSGRHPAGDTRKPPAELLKAILDRDPPRASEAATSGRTSPEALAIAARRATAPDRLRRALRGDLDTVVAKALKKDPQERYPSAEAMAEDLRRHLGQLPVRARADSLSYRTRKFMARHRVVLGAAALAVVALATSAVMAARQARTSARERDRALVELQRSEATNEFNAFLLKEATPSVGRPLTNAELLARGHELIERRFAADPALHVHLLLILADRYFENDQYNPWHATLARAYALSRALADVELRSRAACAQAKSLAENRRFDEAERLAAAALGDLAALPEARATVADCLVSEAFLASAKGDGARAIAAGERAVAIEESRPGPPGHGFKARFELATAYLVAERRLSAVGAYRELMAELEGQGLGETRDAATVLHNWSVTLQRGRQYVQALPIAERAVRIAQERDTEGGAPMLELRGLANALCKVGRVAECARYYDEAVVKARAAGSRRRLVQTLRAAAGAYTQAGEFDRAAASLREAQALQAASADATPNDAALLDLAFGRLELARGHHRAALDLAARGLDRESDSAREPEDTIDFLLLVAEARNAIGNALAARTPAERALALAQGRLGEMTHSSDVGQAHLELGVALAAQGNAGAGRAELRSALEHLEACMGPLAHHTKRAQAQLGRLSPGT